MSQPLSPIQGLSPHKRIFSGIKAGEGAIKWVICPESGVSLLEVRAQKEVSEPSGSDTPFCARATAEDLRRAGLKGGNPHG